MNRVSIIYSQLHSKKRVVQATSELMARANHLRVPWPRIALAVSGN